MHQSKFLRKAESWFKQKGFLPLIGLAGVSKKEVSKAIRIGNISSYFNILIAIILLMQWHFELMHSKNNFNDHITNTSIWLVPTIEYLTALMLVKNKVRFIQQNWLMLLIIAIGIVFIANISSIAQVLSIYRPILALAILMPSLKFIVLFFLDGQLITTLLAALIVVIVFGILISGFDPAIHSFWDGIWWAIATVSTVGYGDVVPTSPLGRLIGTALIVMGIGVFVVITANFLTLILKREAKKIIQEENQLKQILKSVHDITDKQNKILNHIDKLENHLAQNKNPKAGQQMNNKSF